MRGASAYVTAWLTLFALGCGKTDSGGGAGSETHWLLECNQDSDCEIGSCLCGVCTTACSSLRDCPEPLDVCTNESAAGTCEQKVCGSTTAAGSQKGLLSAVPTTVEHHPACDNERSTEVTYIDLGYDFTAGSAANRLIPESTSGFLLFGVTQDFYRIDAAGNLVRTLSPPKSSFDSISLVRDDAILLDDGSMILSGHVQDRAWVGKVDAAWNTVWEHWLDTKSVVPTIIVAAADGGAVVLAQQGNDPGNGSQVTVTSTSWTRIAPEGDISWQHQEATTSPGIVALGGENIRIAFNEDDGIHVLDCDLDGNYDLAPLVRAGAKLTASRLLRLPNDRVGLAYNGGFLVLDQGNQLIWDHSTEIVVHDAAYDPQSEQLYLVGFAGPQDGGTGAERLSLAGDSTWSFSREMWPPGSSRAKLDVNRYGYGLTQAAVDAAGHVAARAPWGAPGLDIMWLDTGTCDGQSVP